MTSSVPALGLLIPASIAAGGFALWTFARFSNQQKIRTAKSRVAASLYELRLFADEPGLIWKAQVALLRENIRYASAALLPAAILALPMYLLYGQLDALLGWEAIRPGDSATVSVRFASPFQPGDSPPVLIAPEGFAVETPAVRVPEEEVASWRVRALAAKSGVLRASIAGDAPIELRVTARSGLQRIVVQQYAGIASGRYMRIDYPAAVVSVAGLRAHWSIWFLGISTATALLLRKRFNVAL